MNFSRLIPAFIPLVYEVTKHLRRDTNHNQNIKKIDKTTEHLGTLEHMIVRLERKVQNNREVYQKTISHVRWWLIINSAVLVAITIKVFFY